VTWIDKTLQF